MFLFDEMSSVGGIVTVKTVVYAIAAGVFLAFFAYWFLQNVVGKLVRRVAKRAVGEENAKTLEELSRSSALYRFLLRDGSTLRNMISCVGGTLPREGAIDEGSVLDSLAEKSSKEQENPEESTPKATLVDAEPEKKKNPFAKQPKADFTRARFFVTEENAEKALRRYPHKVSIWWVVLAFVLALGVSVAASYLLPVILGLFNK